MVNRVFIYGQFLAESELPKSPTVPPLALEILREPSVLEAIGKLYVLTSQQNYRPVTPYGVTNFSWYDDFRRSSEKGTKLFFEAEHGDKWLVRWLRQESDDAGGAYMAVGLSHELPASVTAGGKNTEGTPS
ncbi:MAG TPA: hypothetical protein VG759_11010 [Candidatus Angelobacter sp.]|jgi:hypothetical protein|nr:hypothetical protein [Candidatus Angelobacter sp.]